MFSTSTEGEMFTGTFCARCAHAYAGDQLCDEAAVIVWGAPAPAFLRRVEMGPTNPVGVTCDRFTVATDAAL